MTAVVSAELLRLRTLRSPRWAALIGLLFIAVTARLNLRDVAHEDAAQSLRAFTTLPVLLAAVTAATYVAGEFQRGSATLTYLAHPDRRRVATARCLVHAGLGALFAGIATAAMVVTSGDAGLSSSELLQLVAAAGAGGAIMSAAGVLIGTVARNPTIAGGGIVAVNVAESFANRGGHAPLPFALITEMAGARGGASAPAALGLLVVYLAAFAFAVVRWGLPRDLA